jgi:hypothetical protein
MFAILYETGTSGFYLGYDTTFEDAENRFSRIADDLLENIKSNKKEDFNDFFEMYGIFNASPFCTEYKCYKIATHKNQIIDYKLIFQMVEFCLYVVEIEEKFSPNNLSRVENHFFIRKSEHIEGSIMLIMN